MYRLVLFGAALALVLPLLASDAAAQRDAAAKARGEVGTGFWNPQYRRSARRRSFERPSSPISETYRRYSYEPADIRPGDAVVAVGQDVKLMRGKKVLARLPAGKRLEVRQVRGPWVGVTIEVDGSRIGGWIRRSDLALTADSSRAVTSEPARESYRSFSYEPTDRFRSRSRSRSTKSNPPYVRLHPGSRAR